MINVLNMRTFTIARNLKFLAMKSSYTKYATFLLLWLAYCFLYFTRKPLGIIKSFLANKYSYSKLTIGILDSALLLPYSLFQIVLGNLGDSKNPAKFLVICIICSGISTILLGPLDKLWILILSLFFNGTFQAFCWPLMIKIVSLIFTQSRHHNLILGLFGTSPFAGGTLGTLLSVFLKDRLGWKWVYPIPSIFIIFIGIVLLVFYQLWLKRLLRTLAKIKAVNEIAGTHSNGSPTAGDLSNIVPDDNHLSTTELYHQSSLDVPVHNIENGDFVGEKNSVSMVDKDRQFSHLRNEEFLAQEGSHNAISSMVEPDFTATNNMKKENFEIETHSKPKFDPNKNAKKLGRESKRLLKKGDAKANLQKFSGSFWDHMKFSFVLMWDIPILGFSALAMFSLKMIRYTFYMWLPFIMEYTNEFSSTKAGNVSAIFEIGGVFGSVILGFLLDRFFAKNQFVGVIIYMVLQIVATVAFLLTANPTVNWMLNATILLIVGLFIGGLDNILSSSIPIMLSKTYRPDSASSFIGIINGFGTLGTFLEGPIVGYILDKSSKPIVPKQGISKLPNVANAKTETIDFYVLFVIIGILSACSAIFMSIGYCLFLTNCGNVKKISQSPDTLATKPNQQKQKINAKNLQSQINGEKSVNFDSAVST